MTGTAAVVVGFLSALGLTATVLMQSDAVPWEIVGGGSAALAVIAVVIIMLRNHSETMKVVTAQFSATIQDANAKNKSNADTFAATTATLVSEARDAHQKCEETLHAILRDQLPRRHRATDEPA